MKLKFAALIFVLSIAVSAIAAERPKGDGKELYKSNCKTCHDKGSKNGTYTPMSLVQEQWKRFFSTKLTPSHKSVQFPDGRKVLDLSPEELRAIQKFCVDHAADSEQPATCG